MWNSMKSVIYKDTYKYFKVFCPSLDNKILLDYGCNYGTFLDSSNGRFHQNLYTGIDVDKVAIDEGKNRFPKAKFIHYDAYNIAYNSTGKISSLPQFGHGFDIIISYSVLTHTIIEDFLQTIDRLVNLLNQDGKLLITYLNADHKISKNFFRQKRTRDFGYCDEIQTSDYCYLIDNKISKEPQVSKFFLLWFNNDYLRSILHNYNMKLFDAPAYIPSCFQSCLIITK